MKAVISTTYSDTYLYFLPIVTWCWNKLGVGVELFLPKTTDVIEKQKLQLGINMMNFGYKENDFHYFDAPEHKEATYAQVSRLYAACLDLPEEEVLITSDVDMGVFKIPQYISGFTVTGTDLVPKGQYPMCFVTAKVKDWRNAFNLHGITYQDALDRLLGEDECEHYRGNRWSVDQEQMHKNIWLAQEINEVPRSNGQNAFAQHRYDRDDAYILERLSLDKFDFHMNRPGFQENNFNIILTILKYHYPNDNFDWLVNYTNEYRKLL